MMCLLRRGRLRSDNGKTRVPARADDTTDDNMHNIDDPRNWGRYEPRSMARELTRGGAGAARRRDCGRNLSWIRRS